MSLQQLFGISLFAAALAFLLKGLSSRIAPLLSLLCGLFLLLYAISRYEGALSLLTALAAAADLSDALSAVLRMLAVGLLTAFAADTCRDLGEGTLGARVELCGRVEILLLSLPFLRDLLTLAMEVGG